MPRITIEGSDIVIVEGEGIELSGRQQLTIHHIPKIDNGSMIKGAELRDEATYPIQHTVDGATQVIGWDDGAGPDSLGQYADTLPQFIIPATGPWKLEGDSYWREVNMPRMLLPQRLEVVTAKDAELPIWDSWKIVREGEVLDPTDMSIYPGVVEYQIAQATLTEMIRYPADWFLLLHKMGIPMTGANLRNRDHYDGPGVAWLTTGKWDQSTPRDEIEFYEGERT